MKQFDAHDVTIGGYDFHIFPFPAFKAANLSAELVTLMSPILPLVAMFRNGGLESVLDTDTDKIVSSLQELNGDKLEEILKKLLVKNKNVSIENKENGEVEVLTEDKLNSIFCGEFENLLLLAVEVIKLNYSGFFRSLGFQSGDAGK